MRFVDEFKHEIREIENMWIELSDGCRLAARIWLPIDAEANPVPAILEYLPYRKRDGTAERDEMTHPYFAGHGYASVRVDMRGNGESDGVMLDEYTQQEQDDALEVIEWLTAQPWCSGRVGMIGISWGGFNGLQVAARRPEGLEAIVTICSTDDRYADDIHYTGGCLLNENLGWGSTMLAFSSRPPDPALVGDRWRDMWLERLEAEPFLALEWLRHQTRDTYWKHGSVCEDYSAIEAAVLAVGGWGDAYSNAVPRMISGLSSPRLGLIGPWLHKYPHFAVPEPQIGFLQECLRWWDYWLKGETNDIVDEPLYRVYLQDSVRPQTFYTARPGRWVGISEWPEPNRRLFLNDDSLNAEPGTENTREICSPQTTGIAGGEFCAIWLGPEAPGDQSVDDDGSLVFDTPLLDDTVEILGAATLDLTVSSDRPQGFLVARLCDVAPDGSSTRVTYGVLNLTHRNGHEYPKALIPGKEYRIRLQLDDVAHAFPKGHRIRLALSNAYWPLLWPSPETGTITVTTGVSHLDLPVHTGDYLPTPRFAPAEGARPEPVEALRHPAHERRVEHDPGTGEMVLHIVDDFGETRASHGLTTGEIAREAYRIHPDDPLSARVRIHWTETLRRDDWSVRTETRSRMWCDTEHFYLAAEIEAYEGDQLVFNKSWDEPVRRHLM